MKMRHSDSWGVSSHIPRCKSMGTILLLKEVEENLFAAKVFDIECHRSRWQLMPLRDLPPWSLLTSDAVARC